MAAFFKEKPFFTADATNQKFTIQGELTKPEAKKIGILNNDKVIAYTYVIESGTSKLAKKLQWAVIMIS